MGSFFIYGICDANKNIFFFININSSLITQYLYIFVIFILSM